MVTTGCFYLPLEVTKDADVGKLFAVAVSSQSKQEGPLEAHEAPHAGQEEAVGVGESCKQERQNISFQLLMFNLQ